MPNLTAPLLSRADLSYLTNRIQEHVLNHRLWRSVIARVNLSQSPGDGAFNLEIRLRDPSRNSAALPDDLFQGIEKFTRRFLEKTIPCRFGGSHEILVTSNKIKKTPGKTLEQEFWSRK